MKKPLAEVLQVEAEPAPKSVPGDDGASEGDDDGDADAGYADAGDNLKDALASGDGLSVAKAVEKLVELCNSKM